MVVHVHVSNFKTMQKSIFTLIALFSFTFSFSQNDGIIEKEVEREASFADYDAFKKLVDEVESHREARMVSLERFNSMSKLDSTIILDTRSKAQYDLKHIKGAIHLNFADFTQLNLFNIAPNKNTQILIYCNNNFLNDQIAFPTKAAMPIDFEIMDAARELDDLGITMALNIPTYINLYGYGYRNVYELKDLISVYDQSVEFEGTSVPVE